MAGKGNTIPKPDGTKMKNSRAPKSDRLEVTGEVLGPDLPLGLEWPAQTRAWWHSWRTSAMAQRFTPVDWDFLMDTALLHAKMWLGDTSVAAELRLRVSKLGATDEDRKRLRIDLSKDEKPAQGGVPGAGAYGHLKAV